jgi:protein subunit release factor B
MALFDWNALDKRIQLLNIFERDLVERFVRSSGKGGQNVNKVSTCVILTHSPSGLTVRCEEERSQARNRFLARQRLADRLEALERSRVAQERSAAERRRRQKRRRSKGAKERMLKNKHHRAAIKKNRIVRYQEDV